MTIFYFFISVLSLGFSQIHFPSKICSIKSELNEYGWLKDSFMIIQIDSFILEKDSWDYIHSSKIFQEDSFYKENTSILGITLRESTCCIPQSETLIYEKYNECFYFKSYVYLYRFPFGYFQTNSNDESVELKYLNEKTVLKYLKINDLNLDFDENINLQEYISDSQLIEHCKEPENICKVIDGYMPKIGILNNTNQNKGFYGYMKWHNGYILKYYFALPSKLNFNQQFYEKDSFKTEEFQFFDQNGIGISKVKYFPALYDQKKDLKTVEVSFLNDPNRPSQTFHKLTAEYLINSLDFYHPKVKKNFNLSKYPPAHYQLKFNYTERTETYLVYSNGYLNLKTGTFYKGEDFEMTLLNWFFDNLELFDKVR